MKLKQLLPPEVLGYFKLMRLRFRYPDSTIFTPWISPNASIGRCCGFARGVTIGADVTFGDYSYANTGTSIASGTVGRYCSIGQYCQIGMHDHPAKYASTSPKLYGERNIFGGVPNWRDFPCPPKIGNDVWIGSHVTVLQGISIGDGAIIAAGAVVTRDVEPFTVVGGVPAKYIKDRFSLRQKDLLARWKWWDLEQKDLKKFSRVFMAGERWDAELLDNLDLRESHIPKE